MANGARFALDSDAVWGAGHGLGRASAAPEQQHDGYQRGRHVVPSSPAALRRATVAAQRALREAAAEAVAAAARARSTAAALDETLAVLADAEARSAGTVPPSVAAMRAPVALTPREEDVLALVAEGRSNKAIAEALHVSPNTIKTHVASLLHKHGVGSRAQLAALVGAQAAR